MADTEKDEGVRSMTLGEAREALPRIEEAIKSYLDPNGDPLEDLTSDELGELREKIEASNACKAIIDAAPPKMHFAPRGEIRRPGFGGTKSIPGRGGDGVAEADTKAVAAEAKGDTKSEAEKFAECGAFKSFGHFAYAVMRDCKGPRLGGEVAGYLDRLDSYGAEFKALAQGFSTKAVSGANEFADSEGGIMVPLQYSQGMWQRAISDDDLLGRLDTIPLAGNAIRIPALQDKSRANGSRFGGIRGYWVSEGNQGTNTKPTTRYIDLRLQKAMVLVPVTEELLEDAPAMESKFGQMAAEELQFVVKDAVVNGTGVGMPKGILNETAKITQGAVSGQGTNTIIATNVDAMWARRHSPTGGSYVWLGNQEIEGQLAQLNYSVTNTAATWVYLPQGGITNAPTPMLKGRPLLFIEQAAALGTEGDLILFDPTQYAFAVKSSGVRSAVSMHLRFDYDEQLFKFVLRVDGRSYWDSALTRYKGTNTLSPIVTLNSTRS